MRPLGSHPLLLTTLLATALAGCGGDGKNATNGMDPIIEAPSGSLLGTVVVRISDTPFSDAQAVFITFSDVSGQRSAGGFERLPFVSGSATRTCDMKHLYGGKLELLAQGTLPEGHYSGLRLRISGGRLFFENPTVLPACGASLDPPRGNNAALDLAVPEVITTRDFDVKAAATTTITLDFAGPDSIKRGGSGFVLQPVIRVIGVDGP